MENLKEGLVRLGLVTEALLDGRDVRDGVVKLRRLIPTAKPTNNETNVKPKQERKPKHYSKPNLPPFRSLPPSGTFCLTPLEPQSRFGDKLLKN